MSRDGPGTRGRLDDFGPRQWPVSVSESYGKHGSRLGPESLWRFQEDKSTTKSRETVYGIRTVLTEEDPGDCLVRELTGRTSVRTG